MRRRGFILTLGGAAAWPLAARAQQPGQVRRIGVLFGIAEEAEAQAQRAAFQQRLAQLGWIDGRNVRIDYLWSAGKAGDTRWSRTHRTLSSPLAARP
jgi:putative ABC transport system substrate-binding protein